MKRIATQKNSFWKRFLINIPFVLMVAFMIACFGGFLLLAFYSIVTAVAFHSAMVYLIVAGAAAILLGAGLGLIVLFKKYYAFYNKKMGWKFVEDSSKPDKKEKTVTYDDKNSIKSIKEFIKKYITVSNVSIGVLALGAIFAIISAALGSIDRSNWVKEVGGYRAERGYYADVKYQVEGSFSISDELNISTGEVVKAINKIEVVFSDDDRDKDIVVVYTQNKDRAYTVTVEGYKKFDGDFSCSRTKDGKATIHVGTAPKLGTTLDKLLFFVFDDYYVEKQILVYVPLAYKDFVNIPDADKVIYEDETQIAQ